jgi:hypothetical protein
MVRIDWAQLCEMAFFDDSDRLCMIGVMTRFPAPELPIAMRQIVIVVRIRDTQPDEAFGIGVTMVTPSGISLTPQNTDGFDVLVSTNYVLITLRDVPLDEEGVHRFSVSVGKGNPVSIDVPVGVAAKNESEKGNSNNRGSLTFRQSPKISGREVN